ncbi:hypothetical protein [Nonomuraea sp. NPDC050786]|uniref:hypothetical protein n=1 Tax=Nonomuraea sp. NPDC050786 TaxID=3154840 RepID=UPI00340A1D9D
MSSAVATLGPVAFFLARLASAVGDNDAATGHLTTLAGLTAQNELTWWCERAAVMAGALPAQSDDPAPGRVVPGPKGGPKTSFLCEPPMTS